MTTPNHQSHEHPRAHSPAASGSCNLRPDLAAFFVLGSRKFAHSGQHREYGVLAELRAQFGHD